MLIKNVTIILGLFVYASTEEAAASCIEKLVEMSIEDLMNTKVSSSNKTPTCISQAPNTINAYSQATIRQLGARTLSDLLWTVAGLQVQTGSNNRDKVWIRGVQSEFNNKIALYIDGVPIRDVFGGFPIDEEIPVENIERIEIIRGPGAALYGANAFSGVINIYTFKTASEKLKADKLPDEASETAKLPSETNTLKAGMGENSTHLVYGSVEHSVADAVDVQLQGKWIETNGRKPDFTNTGQVNSRSGAQELGYLHLKLAALQGDLVFNATHSSFDNMRVDKLPTENNLTNKNSRFSLSYKHQFNEDFSIDLNAYHTDTERLEHETRYNSDGSFKDDRKYKGHTYLSGFYSSLNYQLGEDNQMVAGVELKREELLSSGYLDQTTGTFTSNIVDPRYQGLALTNYGFFVQDTQNVFSKQTQFTVGLRYDNLELFKNQFSYRFGLTHAFTDNIYAKLLYGTAYRSPSFVEFTRAPTGTALPDVETVKTLEGQIGYQTKKVRVSLTGYRNSYDNVLQRSNSFNTQSQALGQDSNIFGNFDHQTIIGSEFEAEVTFDEHWKSFLNASWSHAKSLDAQQKLPLLADWTVAVGVEWQSKIYNGNLIFNNYLNIYGKRRDWQSDIWNAGQQQRYPNRSNELTEGFAVWNSSLHYRLPVASVHTVDFDLSIHNVLNAKYYTQSLISPDSNGIANFDSQYQGRQVRFSMSYSW